MYSKSQGDVRIRQIRMIIGRCRSVTAVRVVQYLARCKDRHGKITPHRDWIAGAVGRSPRQVSRAVAELEELGCLRVLRDRPRRRSDGSWYRCRTNLYELRWPDKSPGRPDVTWVSRPCLSETVGAPIAPAPVGGRGVCEAWKPAPEPDDGPKMSWREWLARQESGAPTDLQMRR